MKHHNCQLSIRLPKTLLEQIEQASRDCKETKSTFVKRSIAAYLDFHEHVQLPLLEDQNQRSIHE